MNRGRGSRRHLYVPVAVVATLLLALVVLDGFHTSSGPILGGYFVFLLVAGVNEDVMRRPQYRAAWGVGFLVAGLLLAANGYFGVLTAVLPFVGVALLSNLAYQHIAP